MSGAVQEQRESGSTAGYAGPIGAVAGRPDGQTNAEWVTNSATGGGLNLILGDPIGQRVAGREAEARTAEERRTIEERQRRRTEDLTKLRAAFGQGDSLDAQGNSKRLGEYLQQYYDAYLTNQLGQVDSAYADTSRRSRQNLARVGQLGSGLDTASRRQTLSEYLRQRQDAVVRAAQAKSALEASVQGQRQSLEQQIGAGTIVNPDYQSYIRQQQSTIDQARAAIPANQLGQVFDVAGEQYRTGRLQEVQGNQGLSAYFGAGGGGSGRSSGRIS